MSYEHIQANLHVKIKQYANSHPADECGRLPILDGLTNSVKYQECPLKIMFILKEAYDKDEYGNIGNGGWDHAEYLNDDGNYDYNIISGNRTHQRVSMITTGILRNIDYDDKGWDSLSERDLLDDFKSIAWINVGKYPAPNGTSTSPYRLKKAYQYWRTVLLEQIELYNPKIIIFGNTFWLFRDDISPLFEISKKWPTHIYKDSQGRILLDAYHPQVRPCTVRVKEYVNSIILAVRQQLY